MSHRFFAVPCSRMGTPAATPLRAGLLWPQRAGSPGGRFPTGQTLKRRVLLILMKPLIILTALFLIGCSSPKGPIVVHVSDAPQEGGRFRTQERQRDVWIGPVVKDNEVLFHEQMVTFVEEPQMWRVPQALEPHSVNPPELPIHEGEYDDAVVRDQRRELEAQNESMKLLHSQLEEIKQDFELALKQREESLKSAEEKLNSSRLERDALSRELEKILEAEKQKASKAEPAQKPTSWWKWW
jgi:hypothetical protein